METKLAWLQQESVGLRTVNHSLSLYYEQAERRIADANSALLTAKTLHAKLHEENVVLTAKVQALQATCSSGTVSSSGGFTSTTYLKADPNTMIIINNESNGLTIRGDEEIRAPVP